MEEGKIPFATRRANDENVSSAIPVFRTQAKPGDHMVPKRSPEKKTGIASRFFDGAISVSLFALFFGFPIFFTGATFQGIAFEKQLYFYFWLLIGLVSWVSKGVMQGEMRIRRTPLDVPILLFVVTYGIATIFSLDRWHSLLGPFGDPSRGLLSILALVLAYYFLIAHFTPKRFTWMFGGLVGASSLVVLWSTLAVMGVQFLPQSVAIRSPLSLTGTVSTLVTLLSMTIPIFLTALFALFFRKERKASFLTWIMAGVVFLSLMGNLFLIAALFPFVTWPVILGGLGFFLIFMLAKIVRPPEQWVWVPMLVFVVILSFFMVGEMRIAKANLPVEVLPKLSFAWDIAKSTLGDGHFLLGTGPGNYAYAFSKYRSVEYNNNSLYTVRFDQGPGLLLEALPTIGVLGTIMFVVLAFSFISLGVYLLTVDSAKNKLFSLGLWSAIIMLFIASFMSAFNGTILIFGTLLASLGLAALLWESEMSARYLSLSLKASPKFALALAFIFMVVSAGVAFLFAFIGKAFVADIYAGSVLRQQEVNEQSIRNLGRAAELYSREPRYFVSLGQSYMVLANQEAAKPREEGDAQKMVNYIQNAIASTERASAIAPADVRIAESLGLVYENSALYATDALPKAFDAYQKASDLEPNNPLLLVKLGQIKRAMGDAKKEEGTEKTALYEEAKTFFEKAIEKKQNLSLAHYNLAVTLSRLKENTKAIESISQAIALEPGNVTYRYSLGSLYQARGEGDDYDKAQALYEDILKANEKLIDVRLGLGILYEQKKDRDAALREYRKILEFLPEGAEGDTIRKQVTVFIETLESGRSNIAKDEPVPVVAPTPPTVPVSEPSPTSASTVEPGSAAPLSDPAASDPSSEGQ